MRTLCSFPSRLCFSIPFSATLACALISTKPALADGCFVFHWDKKTDINEPSQKAIIAYGARWEDMLLQVKFEGALQDFGWLIPVPSLPTVTQATMDPFYELSLLTQRVGSPRYGGHTAGDGGRNTSPGDESVQVIETKTVGAYEISVLAATEADSLTRWLKDNDYSIPQGNTAIVDEYISKGWYFIAVKIHLPERPTGSPIATPWAKGVQAESEVRQALQQQLSSGELHPLHISFETPKCIFPLRISAIGGHPSEVSLYILCTEPLLAQPIYDRVVSRIRNEWTEWKRNEKRDEQLRRTDRSLARVDGWLKQLAPSVKGASMPDWTIADMEALAAELEPEQPLPDYEPYDRFVPRQRLLHCFTVDPSEIPACAKVLPQLPQAPRWYLTKHVCTFHREEMHDLEFEPAAPVLQTSLAYPEGTMAADALRGLGESGTTAFWNACEGTNSTARLLACAMLRPWNDVRRLEMLRALLHDDAALIRYRALALAELCLPEPYLRAPVTERFNDPQPEIRAMAARWLAQKETTDSAPFYLDLFKQPDPNLQCGALIVLSRLSPTAVPRVDLLKLLDRPNLDTISYSLYLLEGKASPSSRFIWEPRRNLPGEHLTSIEAAPLTTNKLALIRLIGLATLMENADAHAIELTLPLLEDSNALLRRRAGMLLQEVSGQNIPANLPTRWQGWWAANKKTFKSPSTKPNSGI